MLQHMGHPDPTARVAFAASARHARSLAKARKTTHWVKTPARALLFARFSQPAGAPCGESKRHETVAF